MMVSVSSLLALEPISFWLSWKGQFWQCQCIEKTLYSLVLSVLSCGNCVVLVHLRT